MFAIALAVFLLSGEGSASIQDHQIRPRKQLLQNHNFPSDPASLLRNKAVTQKNVRAIGELKETIETIDDDLEKIANGLDKRVSIANGLDIRAAIANGLDTRAADYLAGYELIFYDTVNHAIYYLKDHCGANAICDGDQIEIFAKEIKDAFNKIKATGIVSRWLRQHFTTLKHHLYDAIVEAEGLLKHKLDAFLGSIPRPGGWSGWTEVSECSATCGAATKLIWRTCTNPAPANGGNECSGESSALVNCALADCAIDGRWTQYSDWGACSKTCGGQLGEKVRTRKCTNPPPTHGGADCLGQKWEVQSCVEVESCPIDGRWTEFSDWGVCSKTCGVGEQVRSRTCTKPPNGGNDCRGHSREVQSCVVAAICPIDGRWTEFSDWGACSATCGEGQKVRTRSCTNPPPSGGGKDCVGHSGEWQVCVEVDICPSGSPPSINGGWTSFGACTKTCEGGLQTRTCTNPPPQHGGQQCTGEASQSCNEGVECTQAIDGRWTEFSDWGVCSKTCGVGQTVRTRSCTNPPPSGGGKDCVGHRREWQGCVEVDICPSGSPPSINGGWTSFGACTKTCEGGLQTRTCTNPPPQNGGQQCTGEASQSCNEGVECTQDGAGLCPESFEAISQNLDGAGKVWAQPHPLATRTKEECAAICLARSGCTSFEFADGEAYHGACGTYTGGDANIHDNEKKNRLDANSNFRSCMRKTDL